MDNYSKLYWLTRLDSLNGLFVFLFVYCFAYCVAVVIGSAISADFDDFKPEEDIKKRKLLRVKLQGKIKWVLPVGILFVVLKCFIPTQNQAIFIMAGGKTLDFVQSDTSINKIPAQTTKLITDYLDKAINDAKK